MTQANALTGDHYDALYERVEAYLHEKKDRQLRNILATEDPSTIAAVINDLPRGSRKVFALLPPELQADAVVDLSPSRKEAVLPRLTDSIIARFLHFCDEDEATDVLQFLTPERQQIILGKMREDKRVKIEKLLTYGSETAGGLMDFNFVVVAASLSLEDVVKMVRERTKEKKNTPVILVQEREKLLGYMPYRDLIFKAGVALSTLAQRMPIVTAATDREQLLESLSLQRAEVICVVDDNQRPIGVIHLEDLLKVAEAEATEDVYRFAGVVREESPLDPIYLKVRRRYTWLIINLATAFLASAVVAQFQDVIAKLAILAVYMPIVAGEGGNAATQALAVVVRGLASGDLDWEEARKVIFREAIAGALNGVIIGVVAAGAAVLFHGTPMLGLVLGLAMVLNLFVAGFFGALVPFVLKRWKVDPAIASSIFVTTATDIFGFLAFLQLGKMLLL